MSNKIIFGSLAVLGSLAIKKMMEGGKNLAKLACPIATKDLMVNTENRNDAIQNPNIQYGPLNLFDQSYWVRLGQHWRTTPDVAKRSNCGNCVAFDISPRMIDCINAGPVSAEDDEVGAGKLGYCWMHHFKCHSARSCYTWAAGGPIRRDKVSEKWQNKAKRV